MDMRRMQSVLTSEQQRQIAGAKKKDERKLELVKVQTENDVLLGKHIVKAQQMRNEDINLLDTTEELQFYCLQKQEELITIKAAERACPMVGGFYERLVKCVKDPSWKNSRTWKIRDVVLIHGTQKSKLLWNLGIIKEVIDGRDNLIRACVMKIAKRLFMCQDWYLMFN
ncbi:rab GTPase-binding effector protein 1 [Caerostris extrusa]|uniref:Rab GTPase-binding effector protein 1 n=1 Tax=Caerostris extrusa TaxID=172846 RepID=A0AAV4M827_CAEEX|nr:rab GTPase-binding effector protein 1 [Caerostris extrusa]